MLVTTLGERPFGLRVAQLLGVLRWAERLTGRRPLRVETSGPPTPMVALTAFALEPGRVSEVVSHRAIPSLNDRLVERVAFGRRLSCSVSTCIGTSTSMV